MELKLSDFDFSLDKQLIAQYPCPKREECMLLVLNRKDGNILHLKFKDIVQFLKEGDVLVINETKVIPARIYGCKSSGGKIEILLLRKIDKDCWECLTRPALKDNTSVCFPGNIKGNIKKNDSKTLINFLGIDSDKIIKEIGEIPLPPYIKRKPTLKDNQYYQTVYAHQDGSVASPTAGLHFSKKLLKEISDRGVEIVSIILHIGWGTFKPVREENICQHKMEEEYYEIPINAAEKINKRRGNLFLVGTTVVRALESASSSEGIVSPQKGWTSLFIYPGYKFKLDFKLITNFHLPKSTLFLLVGSFTGKDLINKAYQEAIQKKYRFYSYGDAMLIL